MALVSKNMCVYIREYFMLKSTQDRLIPNTHCVYSDTIEDSFRDIGM